MNIDLNAWALSGEWITTAKLAQLTETSPSFWAKLRVRGGIDSPPFTRVGKCVRYRRTDVEAWLIARTMNSTSEGGTK